MKKSIAILALPFTLFGFEIVFNKKFDAHVIPDKLTSNITISVNKNSESEITPTLNRFNDIISKSEKIEKRSGDFTIRPNRNYVNGVSNIVGYSGNLNYTIYSENEKDMNKFLKKLISKKDSSDISITISTLNWIVSESMHSKISQDLQLEAILWAEEYSKELSMKIDKECETKKINVSTPRYVPYFAKSQETAGLSSIAADIPVPEVSKNQISINPNFILECK